MEIKPVFFVDFDGTITENDVCYSMVKKFADKGWQEINDLWEYKEISTLECAQKTFDLFTTHDPRDFEKLFQGVSIDPYFKEFASYCQKSKFPIYILSDGYDFYIRQILLQEGLEHIPFYANHLKFESKVVAETPYCSNKCNLCGVCKTEIMEKLQKSDETAIYIGDGASDICSAKKAQVVFAKGKLLEYCLSMNIPALKFENFQDIMTYWVK